MSLTPARRRALARLYGLTPEEYETLFDFQRGRCALCERPFTAARSPVVDHEHAGRHRVRALLCYHCNYQILGMVREDPDFFARVAAYLREPPALAVIGERIVPGAPPVRDGAPDQQGCGGTEATNP
jgi:hypothetical protein